MSVVMRVPNHIAKQINLIARTKGIPTSQVLAEAWEDYERKHAKEWAELFAAEADRLRQLE